LPSREIRRAQQKLGLEKKRDQVKKKAAGRKKGGPKKQRISVKQFLSEVQAEMKKVTWPTRQEVASYTAVVLIVVILVGSFVFGLDHLFTWLVRILIIR
jgi:preprotein translocase subunit SecE